MNTLWKNYRALLSEGFTPGGASLEAEKDLTVLTRDRTVHESLSRVACLFLGFAVILLLSLIVNLVFPLVRGESGFMIYFLMLALCSLFSLILSVLAATTDAPRSRERVLSVEKKESLVTVFSLVGALFAGGFAVIDFALGMAFPAEHVLLLLLSVLFAPRSTRAITLSFLVMLLAGVLSATLIGHWNAFSVISYGLSVVIAFLASLSSAARDRALSRTILRAENARLLFANDTMEDSETGVLSRRGLESRLIEMIQKSYGESLHVLLLDVDGLDDCLRLFGRAQANAALREIGQELQAELAPKDILARHASSQFVVVFSGLSEDEALAKARGLKKSVASLEISTGVKKPPYLTASVGLVTRKVNASLSFEHALALADHELTHAQEQGGDCLLYQGKMYR